MVAGAGAQTRFRGQDHPRRLDEGGGLGAGLQAERVGASVSDDGGDLRSAADVEDDLGVDRALLDALDDAGELVSGAGFHGCLLAVEVDG
jgi:hypothetical protein